MPAYADLIGSSVMLYGDYGYFGEVFSSAGPAIVGPGVEFPFLMAYNESFDITGNQIVITSFCGGKFGLASFNGFVFDFAGAPVITAQPLIRSVPCFQSPSGIPAVKSQSTVLESV